jgi:hypothetical protein
MAMATKKKTFVLYPLLGGPPDPDGGAGQAPHPPGLGVVIAVVDPPDAEALSAAAVARLAADNPDIAFRLLPSPASPDVSAHPVKRRDDTLLLTNPALRDFLRALPAVDAILLDLFCVHALDVAAELSIQA